MFKRTTGVSLTELVLPVSRILPSACIVTAVATSDPLNPTGFVRLVVTIPEGPTTLGAVFV